MPTLVGDFNQVQVALKIAIMQSKEDRPELAALLVKQRIAFYRNLLTVEGSLALHACGFERMPSVDLLLPLKTMQAQLQELTAMPAMAGARV